jgi:hypothetical protein
MRSKLNDEQTSIAAVRDLYPTIATIPTPLLSYLCLDWGIKSGCMDSTTGIDSQPEVAQEERNMEMKNSAYNQEKRASAPPPPPLYDQETGRESNQGSSRNQSPQLYATTSLYQSWYF